MSKPYLSQFSFRSNIGITWSVFIQRILQISRYKAALISDLISPILFSAFPVLLGISIAGSYGAAQQQFDQSVGSGSANVLLYMIISANVFNLINGAIFNFGFFLRREQQTGTLESLYLAPVSQIYILIGTAFYAILRGLINFVGSVIIISLILGINPITSGSSLIIALLILLVGLLPLYGLSFAFGSLILKFKDMSSMQFLVTMFLGFLMGMFFPITLFPKWLQFIAFLFPTTWQNNGVRAALTGTSWILSTWYSDFAIIIIFAIVYPLMGGLLYLLTDRTMRKTEGLGVF